MNVLRLLRTKAISTQRYLLCRFLSDRLPLYIVTEYPKSGGTWFSQMLSEYLEIPFPRRQAPPFRSCVMHGHYLHHPSFRNVFCVIRDGRDAAVSAYFHCLLGRPGEEDRMAVEICRREVPFDDYDDVRGNLPAFIDYLFTRPSTPPFRFSWSQFVLSWLDRGFPIIRYEDLLRDAPGTVGQAVHQVTGREIDRERLEAIARKYSFENLAKRKPGVEDRTSFLRKGVAGDWRNKFSPEACRVFDSHAGQLLLRLGYAKNRDWAANANGTIPDHQY